MINHMVDLLLLMYDAQQNNTSQCIIREGKYNVKYP